ncbi:hypothetical protein BgiBS90_027149, partial [Biomphalaria glabrata]
YIKDGNARRFVICGNYGSCSGDVAYFLAVDQVYDYCRSYWNVPNGNYPIFITSKSKDMIQISSKDYVLADVMAIFVKF